MSDKPDINELFEAARRREADQRRQHQLSEMIDRLAAQETNRYGTKANPASRRHLWPYISAAASILLLVGIGLHIISDNNTTSTQQTLIAETKPEENAVVGSTTDTPVTESEIVIPVHRQKPAAALASNEMTAEVPCNELPQEEADSDETILDAPDFLPDEPLLAEEPTFNNETSTDNDSKQSKTIVFERTSTRLVCGAGCRPEVQASQDDTPLFTFTNTSSTGTTIGIGNYSY